MTERDEQGFVKDIKVAIDAISNENKSSKEKVKELIELPFSVEDVLDVVNFVNQETSEEVDVRDELYNLAILNEQLVSFDDMFKSKLEERHKELVEALMNRMEGVFKMYDENVKVPMNPEMEQPVEVQTPQLSEFNPEAPVVEPMEVGVVKPIATVETQEVAPAVDASAYIEPSVYGEMPQEVATPVAEAVNEYAAPVEAAPVYDSVAVASEYAAPTDEVSPVQEEQAQDDYNDFMALLNSLPADFYQEPEKEVEDAKEEEAPVEAYAEPEAQVEETTEEDYSEPTNVIKLPVAEASEEVAPVAEVEEEDEEVREIIDRYDRLKVLNINVHNNKKRLAQLREEAARVEQQYREETARVEQEIESANEEIQRLAA